MTGLSSGKSRGGTRVGSALNHKLEKSLAAYVMAGAGIAVLAPTQAPAEIVYTPVNQTISTGAISFDLNHDGVADFTLHDQSGFPYDPPREIRVRGYGSYAAVAGNGRAAALGSGVTLGSSAQFTSVVNREPNLRLAGLIFCSYYFCSTQGQWKLNGKPHFLGLKIVINGETHFGWARMSVDLRGPGHDFRFLMKLHVVDYAYESTPDKAIVTGDTGDAAIRKENFKGSNASLGLLSVGARGIPVWRQEQH